MKTTKEKIEIMQAFEDGKRIEYKHGIYSVHGWHQLDTPDWNWSACVYRIAEPKKVKLYKWVVKDENDIWFETACFYKNEKHLKEYYLSIQSDFKRLDYTMIEVEE